VCGSLVAALFMWLQHHGWESTHPPPRRFRPARSLAWQVRRAIYQLPTRYRFKCDGVSCLIIKCPCSNRPLKPLPPLARRRRAPRTRTSRRTACTRWRRSGRSSTCDAASPEAPAAPLPLTRTESGGGSAAVVDHRCELLLLLTTRLEPAAQRSRHAGQLFTAPRAAGLPTSLFQLILDSSHLGTAKLMEQRSDGVGNQPRLARPGSAPSPSLFARSELPPSSQYRDERTSQTLHWRQLARIKSRAISYVYAQFTSCQLFESSQYRRINHGRAWAVNRVNRAPCAPQRRAWPAGAWRREAAAPPQDASPRCPRFPPPAARAWRGGE
jgi:hypothetical protein